MNGCHKPVLVLVANIKREVFWLRQKARIVSDDVTLSFLVKKTDIFAPYGTRSARRYLPKSSGLEASGMAVREFRWQLSERQWAYLGWLRACLIDLI